MVLNAPRSVLIDRTNYIRDYFSLRSDQKIVLYQGALMPGRGIEDLIAAFSSRKNDEIVLVVMGLGLLQNNVLRAANLNSNIFFHSAVPASELLNITSSRIGIHVISNTYLNHDYCMPNKLFEYLMADYPLLFQMLRK